MSAILRSFVLAMTCLVAMSDSHDGAKLAKMKELPTDEARQGHHSGLLVRGEKPEERKRVSAGEQ
jgi:hypothetical protein